MPPKRHTKATAGSQPVSASQPTPQKPTRASGRKRRHSDASNASDAGSTQDGAAMMPPANKRKRGRPAANSREPEVIEEEEEEEVSQARPTCEGPGEHATEDSIEVSQSRHVHFGSDDTEGEGEQRSTATNLTPHPRAKMPITKRKTLSPGATGGSSKRLRVMSRTSLPPTLSQDPDSDASTVVQELHYAPLGTVLQGRVRRIQELKGHQLDGAADVEMANDDMLVLDHLEESAHRQLPTAPQTPVMHAKVESSAGEGVRASTPNAAMAEERKNFHDAILALEKECTEYHATMRILRIECDALGFAEPGTEPLLVLQSIRTAFANARNFFHTELPGTLPDNASDQDVFEVLIANVKEFAGRLRLANEEAAEKDTVITDLSVQVDGLLDRLAEKQVRISQLEDQWKQLDTANEAKARELEDLTESYESLLDETKSVEKERDDAITEADGSRAENLEFEQTVQKLTTSLETYRNEETRLSNLIHKMETEHRATVTNMNKEREETVADLEGRLDVEVQQHSEAANQAEERQVAIEELEAARNALEAERDELNDTLETLTIERDEELGAKEVAEADLETKNLQIDDLTARVDRLEADSEDLLEQIQELRQLNETVQKQREAAERDLDDRNQEIEELGHKLQEQGKQANELRQKLFEVQKKHQDTVTTLEAQLSERDVQFQTDIAFEVERREAADELAQQRAATILDLETRLETVEQEMQNLLLQKTTRIEQIEEVLADRDIEVHELREDLRAVESTAQIEIDNNKERVEDLEGSIAALKDDIAEHEDTIQALQQQALADETAHTREIQDREQAAGELENRIDMLQAEKEELVQEVGGLERRITSEAMQMLQLQNDTGDQIEALKATIREKQADIVNVEQKARTADSTYQEVLEERDEQIETLHTKATASADTIAAMTQQNDDIKHRFREYVRRSGDCINSLQDLLKDAKAAADEDGNAMKAFGDAELEAMEAMDDVEEMHEATSSHAARGKKVVRKAKGRKRTTRNFDSGIGIDGETAEEEAMIEA